MTAKKKHILTLIIFSIVAILAAEIFLRIYHPVYFCNMKAQFQRDSKLGFIAKPNFKKSILTDHIIEVFTNDIGSRNYVNGNELAEYKKLVFCVGDSYTEGVGCLTDQSYPFYLDLLLNRNKGNGLYEKNFAVVNLGLGAYGSIQSYIVSKIYTEKFGRFPDVIIYLICENDISDDIAFKNSRVKDNFSAEGHVFNCMRLFFDKIVENFQLSNRIKLFFTNPKQKKSLNNWDIKDVSKDLPGLVDLINFSRENNIKLIISYTYYRSDNYILLKKFASQNNIYFADYKPSLESVINTMPSLPVSNRHSGGHFRSWVNFIIANSFAELLESK